MQIQPVNNISFKAIPLSKVKIITDGKVGAEYTLYKAIHHDEPFLEELYNRTNIMKRYKNLSQTEYQIWDGIMSYGLNQMLGNDKYTLLIADKLKRPCGFLNYTEYPEKIKVNYAATWPNKQNERGIMAGKALFTELFTIFLKDIKRKTITLEALRFAPFSPVSKYMELGFKMCGGSEWQETMRISDIGVSKSIEKFKQMIVREEIKKETNINFYDKLKFASD